MTLMRSLGFKIQQINQTYPEMNTLSLMEHYIFIEKDAKKVVVHWLQPAHTNFDWFIHRVTIY